MREKQAILQQIAAKKNGKKLTDIHEVKKKQIGFPDLNQSDLLPLIHRRIANIKKPAAYSLHLSAEQNNIKNKLNDKESEQTIKNTDLFNRETVQNKVKRIGTVKPLKPFTMVVEGQTSCMMKKQSLHKRTSLEIRQSNREINIDQKNPYLKDQILMEKMKKKSQQKILQKQNQNQIQLLSKKKNKIKKKNKKLKAGMKKQELLQKPSKQLGSFQQQANKTKRQEEITINQNNFSEKKKSRANNHKQKSYNIVINMVSNRGQSDGINSAKDVQCLSEVKKQYSIAQYEEDQCQSKIPSDKSININQQQNQALSSSKIIKTPSKKVISKNILNSSHRSINKIANFISKTSKLQTNSNNYQDKIDQSLPFCNKARMEKKGSVNLQKIRAEQKINKQGQIKDRRPSCFKVSSQSFKISENASMNINSNNGYLKKCPINQLNLKQKFHKINLIKKQSNTKEMKLNEYLQQAKQICKNNSLHY